MFCKSILLHNLNNKNLFFYCNFATELPKFVYFILVTKLVYFNLVLNDVTNLWLFYNFSFLIFISNLIIKHFFSFMDFLKSVIVPTYSKKNLFQRKLFDIITPSIKSNTTFLYQFTTFLDYWEYDISYQ